MGLVGLLFNIVTLPGILVNSIVQEYYAEKYGVDRYQVTPALSPDEEGMLVRIHADDAEGLDWETLAAHEVDESEVPDHEWPIPPGAGEEEAPLTGEPGDAVPGAGDPDDGGLLDGTEVNPDGLAEDDDWLLLRIVEDDGSEIGEETLVTDYTGIDTYGKMILLALMPFVATSVLCFLAFLVGVPLFATDSIPFYVTFWLGLSFGAHAFPNGEATDALWRRTKTDDSLLRVVGAPFVGVSKVANVLQILWLDAIYAVVIYFVVTDFVVPVL